jgi:signal transduction histidine kinase
MMDELKEYFDLLLNLENPIYYSIFFTLAIFILFYFFFKYILNPVQKKHFQEKKELEIKNTRLMALFAELDPDPLIRIDINGRIIHLNDTAKELINSISPPAENIDELIPGINFSIKEYIEKNKSILLAKNFGSKFYSVFFRGISDLEIAQIYFNDLTERKKFEEELELSRNKLKELSKHLQNTLEEERQRISRELHDGVGHSLLLIRLKIQALEKEISEFEGQEKYKMLLDSIDNSIKELKGISYNLKPRILEEMGLAPSLRILCDKVSAQGGIYGTIDIFGPQERFSNNFETALYRLTQEALNNIVKHSKAKVFNVQYLNESERVKLIISDDGIGLEDTAHSKRDNNPSGMGLINMQERIENFNGKFKIDSSPENGTILFIEVPKEAVLINA